jgi:hypothetical protein
MRIVQTIISITGLKSHFDGLFFGMRYNYHAVILVITTPGRRDQIKRFCTTHRLSSLSKLIAHVFIRASDNKLMTSEQSSQTVRLLATIAAELYIIAKSKYEPTEDALLLINGIEQLADNFEMMTAKTTSKTKM